MKKFLLLLLLFFVFACSQNKYEFDLIGVDKNYKLSDFSGENVVVYFGYTQCADVCPASLGIMSDVMNELKLDDVKLIFISLDFARDDAKIASEYAQYFHKNAIGLVPKNKQDLDDITQRYGAKYEYVKIDSVMDYSVAHSSSFYVFDKKSNFLGEISNLSPKNVAKQLRKFLNID